MPKWPRRVDEEHGIGIASAKVGYIAEFGYPVIQYIHTFTLHSYLRIYMLLHSLCIIRRPLHTYKPH